MVDAQAVRIAALREAADLCKREANLYLSVAEIAEGRDRKDRRAKAAAAHYLYEQLTALIEGKTR